MKQTAQKNLKGELVSALASDIKENEKIFTYLLIQELRRRMRGKKEVDEPKDRIVVNSKERDQESALARADEKIGEALGDSKEGQDNQDNADKYKNIDSILKYVENPNDKGQGVKLVIMNFND